MEMYYAFENHIDSLSLMNIHLFLIWKTYIAFCI